MASPREVSPSSTYQSSTFTRRRRCSTVESLVDGMTIEDFVARGEKWMVTCPGKAVLTAESVGFMDNENPFVAFEVRSRDRIERIAEKHGVRLFGSSNMVYHSIHGRLEVYALSTRDENKQTWTQLVAELHSYLEKHGFEKVQVQLCNPELLSRDTFMPITETMPAIDKFLAHREEFITCAHRFLPSLWLSIGLVLNDNPDKPQRAKPVLAVLIREGTYHDFQMAQIKMEAIAAKIEVPVEFTPGRIDLCFVGDGRDLVHSRPFSGASIALVGDASGAGTLGGFFNLLPPAGLDLNPKLCALTCHRLIRPLNKEDAEKSDKNGIPHNSDSATASWKGEVQYPSRIDLTTLYHQEKKVLDQHRTIKQEAEWKIDAGEDSEAVRKSLRLSESVIASSQRLLRKCEERAADPRIGTVMVSSGLALSHDHRLDWALIEINRDQSSRNKPPTATEVNSLRWRGKSDYAINETDFITCTASIEAGAWAVKKGRTTGVTCGNFSEGLHTVNWHCNQRPTTEWVAGAPMTSKSTPFAEEGDSGAFVLNAVGGLVGMAIGTYNGNGKYVGWGIVTPINEIIEDVKKRTNGCRLQLI